jgi:hypothetical protein
VHVPISKNVNQREAASPLCGVLTNTTGKDLSAVLKADLNVKEGKDCYVVVKTYFRNHQTSIKKVTELALFGYCLKDDQSRTSGASDKVPDRHGKILSQGF